MKKQKNHFQDYKDMMKPPKVGDIATGKVVGKTKDGIFVDIKNYKTGIIEKKDLDQTNRTITKIKKGDELSAKVVDLENKDGYMVLSLKKADEYLNWRNLEELRKRDEEFVLGVIGANKGGLIFNYSGIQGFLPASQLSREHYPKIENPTPERIFEELKKLVGGELKVKILKTDAMEKKLIFREA